MLTIHKFKIEINDALQGVNVRDGAKFLTAAMQGGDLCLWFEHDTEKPVMTREFRVFGTGHQIQGFQKREWRATVLAKPFVWHVYEVL